MGLSLIDMLRGLRFMGAGNLIASVRYPLTRDRLNTRVLRGQAQPVPLALGELQSASPTPNGGTFSFEHATLEIEFLAPDVIRTTWSPGEPPVPYAIAEYSWPGDRVELAAEGERWSLRGTDYQMQVELDGALHHRTLAGELLRLDRPPQRAGTGWTLETELSPEGVVCGLGERAAGLNLRGSRFRFWNLDPGGSYGADHDPLYLSIPVYYVLQHAGGYLLFHENAHDGAIEFGDVIQVQFDLGRLQSYWIPGDPAHALARYSDLTGRAPLPPRWALGYHQSRWGYRSEQEIRRLAADFKAHDLPLDAVHLDLDYMDGKRVFTVDRRRFPRLSQLADELLQDGVRLVTIVDPGVKVERGYDVFSDGLERNAFCRGRRDRLQQAPVWPGWCVFPDFTASEARKWWAEQYPRLLDQGVAGIWHDMNEPAAFAAWGDLTLPLDTRHELEGQGGDHRSAHNLYGLMMDRAGYEALRAQRPGRRPFLLTRSGWAGVQRYAWTWSGDTESSWTMLARTIGTLLGLGMSGVPFVGSDIGGFSGRPDAELYLRWLQLAAFTPFFRTHSALGTERREPWAFDERTLDLARTTLKLRRSLLPYIYSQAWESCRLGIPLMRPSFWADPGDETLWTLDDAFMLGDTLLVAPVLHGGADGRTLRLPAGGWVDFHSGRHFSGPGEITLPVDLESIPLLVRAGALLPRLDDDLLTLQLYLPGPDGEAGLLYHDAGDGYGPSRVERFRLVQGRSGLRLLRRQEGAYTPQVPTWLEPVGGRITRATADGEALPIEAGRCRLPPFDALELQLA